MKNKFFENYCSGCGLCAEKCGVEFYEKEGFLWPKIKTQQQKDFCKTICPATLRNFNNDQNVKLWGNFIELFSGWSCDDLIRHQAASGGVLTGLCLYLLDKKICDYVIQIGIDSNNPYKIELKFNNSREAVIKSCSSRYITGLTYENLFSQIDYSKRYAIIGKPCDIEAITNYMKSDSEFARCILYRFTFFCAGAPSINANKEMVKHLGFNANSIKHISYRGNGWPGKATVMDSSGEVRQMEYIDSWNKFLGRNIRKICKFCINGTGIYSDISCGDLWKLENNDKPIFDEQPGQNIVVARSNRGVELLINAKTEGYIELLKYNDLQMLNKIQPNHYNMQTLMFSKILVMKAFFDACPYSLSKLYVLSKTRSKKIKIRTALGTLKRKLKRQL